MSLFIMFRLLNKYSLMLGLLFFITVKCACGESKSNPVSLFYYRIYGCE